MNKTDAIEAAAVADVYRLLSACFYQPEAAFGEEDVFGQLAEALGVCAPQIQGKAVLLGSGFREISLDDLLLDYTRLFLGPYEILAKPYGSCYVEGEKVVMGDSTMNAKACYQQIGFEPAEDFLEMPDHVAVELEFLYLVNFRKAEALAAGKPETAAEFESVRRTFLQNHLGSWVADFSTKITAGATSNFYRVLGELLQAFVEDQKPKV